jgi:hypothetical protein
MATRKKRPKPDDPAQMKRFIEAAEKAGIGKDSKKAFEKALGKIVVKKTV